MAIYPPPEALDDVVAQAGRLRIGAASAAGTNVRLARRENLHLTLAFLGDVADARLPDVQSALGRSASGWRHTAPLRRRRTGTDSREGADAGRSDPPAGPDGSDPGGDENAGPPRLRLAGGGRFGRGQFTVLWVGVRGDLAALHALHAAVRRELRRDRLPYDRRPYRPHLTVARPGDRVEREVVDADRDKLQEYFGPCWPVAEIVLVRSHLGPRPQHERLAAWPI